MFPTRSIRSSMFRKWLKTEWFSLLAMIVLLLAGRSSLADHYHVPSGSMEHSLLPGDRVVVNKTAYGVRLPFTTIDLFGASGPERGDVAVFDSPLDGRLLIKRIVAVGGDTVTLRAGRLSINGRPLATGRDADARTAVEHFGDKRALLNLGAGGGRDIAELVVPHGQVLALGDHRGDSVDGRMFGLIEERLLLGRALGVYYRKGEGVLWVPL